MKNCKKPIAQDSGLGIISVVQIVFLILKLIKLIDWPWWAVLIPTWSSLGTLVLTIIIALLVLLFINNTK